MTTKDAERSAPLAPTNPLLLDREQYRTLRVPNVFRTPDSFKYFIRQNYNELVQAGAVIAPQKRQMIQPQRFDEAIVTIGQRMAAIVGRNSEAS